MHGSRTIFAPLGAVDAGATAPLLPNIHYHPFCPRIPLLPVFTACGHVHGVSGGKGIPCRECGAALSKPDALDGGAGRWQRQPRKVAEKRWLLQFRSAFAGFRPLLADWGRTSRRFRDRACSRPYRSSSSTTCPWVPSTRTRWPFFNCARQPGTDITAGIFISRAVTAPCESGPPLSVITATAR